MILREIEILEETGTRNGRFRSKVILRQMTQEEGSR